MKNEISTSEFARNLADFLARVAYRKETFLIRRGTRIMAEVRPTSVGMTVGKFLELSKQLPELLAQEKEDFSHDLERARQESAGDRGRNRWDS